MIFVVLPVAGRVAPTTLFVVSDHAIYIFKFYLQKGIQIPAAYDGGAGMLKNQILRIRMWANRKSNK